MRERLSMYFINYLINSNMFRYFPKVSFFSISFFIFCLFSNPDAGVIFGDDFSDESRSNLNWGVVGENNYSVRFRNGYAELENGSSVYIAFVMHSLGGKTSPGTFTGRIVSDIPGAGIFYCTGRESGFFVGYAVIIGDDELLLLEYGAVGERELLICDCKFLYKGNNNLSISGDERKLSVFCNGYFQFSFPNSLGPATDVAFVIPPSSTVSFDDVLVTDSIADTTRFPLFRDSLTDKSMWGWQILGPGNYSNDKEGLHLNTSNSRSFYAGVLVPLADFHMAVKLRYENGSVVKPFGLVLFGLARSNDIDSLVPYLRFGVNASEGFLIEKRSTAGWDMADSGVFSGHLSGDRDSLSILRSDKECLFYINANLIASMEVPGDEIRGGGIFAAESLSVSFRYFSLSDRSDERMSLSYKSISLRSYGSRFTTDDCFFDLMGRKTFIPSRNHPPLLMIYGRKNIPQRYGKRILCKTGN